MALKSREIHVNFDQDMQDDSENKEDFRGLISTAQATDLSPSPYYGNNDELNGTLPSKEKEPIASQFEHKVGEAVKNLFNGGDFSIVT
jgi:hypothetical protein